MAVGTGAAFATRMAISWSVKGSMLTGSGTQCVLHGEPFILRILPKEGSNKIEERTFQDSEGSGVIHVAYKAAPLWDRQRRRVISVTVGTRMSSQVNHDFAESPTLKLREEWQFRDYIDQSHDPPSVDITLQVKFFDDQSSIQGLPGIAVERDMPSGTPISTPESGMQEDPALQPTSFSLETPSQGQPSEESYVPHTFNFTLRIADGGSLGLELRELRDVREVEGGAFLVTGVVEGGAVASWNWQCQEGPQFLKTVCINDVITSVNGRVGCRDMAQEIDSQMNLHLELVGLRPWSWYMWQHALSQGADASRAHVAI